MKTATHAGTVVYRDGDGSREYLLISAKQNPSLWVLPKGHIEPGETAKEAAVRETSEEAGIVCKIETKIGRSTFVQRGAKVRVDFYLAKFKKEVKPEEDREIQWCRFKTAIELLAYNSLKDILRRARETKA